jgi:mRNA-degrading endonuclease toxin of MazEF toxin-antitoxin module
VIVQATETLDLMESVTVCPITSVETGADFVRVSVAAGRRSGLNFDSWIMADKVVTVPRAALKSGPIGRVDAQEMADLEGALKTWLDL